MKAVGENQLSRGAKTYLLAVAATAAAVALPAFTQLSAATDGWTTFLILAGAAAAAQLFVVHTPRDQSYHTSTAFVLPAVFLLEPELIALLAVVQHVPEWLKVRYPWFIQSFNICNQTLNLMGAWAASQFVLSAWPGGDLHARAVAGLAACVVYVLLNHVLLGVMLNLARGHSLRATGLFSLESLSTDLVLAGLGVAIWGLSRWDPWLIPFAIAPLVLIQRSLSVPALQQEARIDPKTGLFNARHFAAALREELARAVRFERPMSIVMADLDLLRDINNTYGHLAGDAVLQGIADIFRLELRDYDVPARFGGEEFALLLPETSAEQALEIAERIRRKVAATSFELETSSEPVRATVSLGVATYPEDGADANELIHQADLAVYRAKLQGRNRALPASPEALLVPGERSARLAAVREDGDLRTGDTQKTAQKLREAAETIRKQNVSLEQANRLLRERSTAAMESLSATVDARDAYTAGHSRRVQQLALAIGRELRLSQAELEVLGHAALFHDIGKLAIPDAVLLKPGQLTGPEWTLMQRHADEGARIIDRLGFLDDAVPAIRHHHERFDGHGYPDGLAGEDIPLGARIVHVADALDSMVTTRIYRGARPAREVLTELAGGSGTQFCPRCVAALERVLHAEEETLPLPALAQA